MSGAIDAIKGWTTVPTDIRTDFIKQLGGKDDVLWTFDTTREDSPSTFYPFPATLEDFLNGDNVVKDTYKNFIKFIPKIQVRAYVPEIVLNEILNLLSPAFRAVKSGIDVAMGDDPFGAIKSALKDEWENIESFFSNIRTENGFSTFIRTLGEGLSFNSDFPQTIDSKYYTQVVSFPYILYYKLIGAKTNNIYEFPAYVTDGFLNSDGSYGWPQQSGNFGAYDAFGGRGKIIDFLLKNLNVSYMPFFNPQANDSKNYAEIKCSFNLVNDTRKKALANYGLIHSLHMNNLWIQSGMIQGPASLYDVKLLGGQRLFMCTASIDITYSGAYRTLQVGEGELESVDVSLANAQNGLRIPEVYNVSINFKSLMPNNFNNFVMAKLASASQELFHIGPGKETLGEATKFFENVGNAVNKVTDMPLIADSELESGRPISEQATIEEQIEYDSDLNTEALLRRVDDVPQDKLDALRSSMQNDIKDARQKIVEKLRSENPNITKEEICENVDYLEAGLPHANARLDEYISSMETSN